ncbi:MAG: DinB family protein [Chloroflexi bacterium]|nr:MAG: DinB family protein [Chloroflexota bacterium]
MDLLKWFDSQLRSTLDGFIWSVRQIPEERWYAFPPAPLGEWSAAQHIFHMVHYEKKLALPSMHQWLGAPPAVREEADEEIWNHPPAIKLMLDQFNEVRLAEINLLPSFDEMAWQSTQKTTFWGEISLYWLVCKTYQHTLDHTQDILRLALFWDRMLARMSQE